MIQKISRLFETFMRSTSIVMILYFLNMHIFSFNHVPSFNISRAYHAFLSEIQSQNGIGRLIEAVCK